MLSAELSPWIDHLASKSDLSRNPPVVVSYLRLDSEERPIQILWNEALGLKLVYAASRPRSGRLHCNNHAYGAYGLSSFA